MNEGKKERRKEGKKERRKEGKKENTKKVIKIIEKCIYNVLML